MIKVWICVIHPQISLIYNSTPPALVYLEGIGGIRVDVPIIHEFCFTFQSILCQKTNYNDFLYLENGSMASQSYC